MQRRRTAAQATRSDGRLTLRCLLKIKDRREDRVRRQMAELSGQQRQIEAEQQQCQVRRTELASALNHLLTWSGTLLASALLAQKQKMNGLFHQEYHLALKQRSLLDRQKNVQARWDGLHRELLVVMKKKEKLRSLLNNEYCQN